jgi:peroxiredoxin
MMRMADEPPISAPPEEPCRRAGLGLRVLPFVPIVVALATALIVRQFYPKPAPAKLGNELIGTKAPDFSLRDVHKEEGEAAVTLSLLAEKGPVVVVFYSSYVCPRCVGHLKAIADEFEAFTDAGLQVIAISPDTPANTRDSIQTYGDFPFPLLFDRESKVAGAFGLVNADGNYLPGVFIIDRDRRIQFAARSEAPEVDIGNVLELGRKLQKPQ